MLQQALALALVLAQLPGAAIRERQLDQPEQCKRPEDRRCEREPEVTAARGDRAEALVGLEQKRPAVRTANRQVHLEQLPEVALEAILGPREVAHLRDGLPGGYGALLVAAEWIARADQPVLVGVDDTTRLIPDLHAHNAVAKHPATDDAVEPCKRRRIAAEHRGRDRRLDDAPRCELCHLPRVPDRLVMADVPKEVYARRRQQDQRRQAAQGVLQQHAAEVACRPCPAVGAVDGHRQAPYARFGDGDSTIVVGPMSPCG